MRGAQSAITATTFVPARSWNSLADLDELLLRCLSPVSEEYLAEAVACYRGGAFRASIVATWVAVTYDYIDKLNELALSGETAAEDELKKFDEAHRTGKVDRALKLERTLLDVAKNKFELLSDIEYADLARLRDDRHRCAHPTHEHSGDPYQPTAEQARVHIRNAVEHMLSRPPVQGKAALDRVMSAVDSDYFPTSVDDAVDRLESGPLAHARIVLTRNVAVVLLKGALVDEAATESLRERRRTALGALHQMDLEETEGVIYEKVNGIIDGLADAGWVHVLRLIQTMPIVWEALSDPNRALIETVVDAAAKDGSEEVLRAALQIDALADRVAGKATEVELETLSDLLAIHPHPDLVSELARRLRTAPNFATADRVFDVVRRELDHLTVADVHAAAEAYVSNNQFHWNKYGAGLMTRLVERGADAGGVDESAMIRLATFADENEDAGLVTAIREAFPGVAAELDARKEAPAVNDVHV